MKWFEHGRPFEGYTVVILGQGPSIVPEEAEKISHIFPTIAIKDTYQFAPRAVMIYASDISWWMRRWKESEELRNHTGLRVVLNYQKLDPKVPDLLFVKTGGQSGFVFNEGYVAHGRNSGHQTINLVANMGARKIILLGFDMKVRNRLSHHPRIPHGKVPSSVFDDFRSELIPAAPKLLSKGIQVVNTCLDSAISCFPKMSFNDALEWGYYV